VKKKFQIEVPGGSGKILLHACCAPCSGAIVEYLVKHGVRPVIFFSNSNITPFDEYSHRLNECIRYAREFGLKVVEDNYDHDSWLTCAAGLETEPERGARCLECFKHRLLRAAQYAAANGFDVLTTTLASSRWKSLEQVNEAGTWACAQVSGVTWWGQNWRKGGLQDRRNEIIREQNFYNQLFCGCEFSQRTGSAEPSEAL
jgi:predicted adenine nucleotide alpha hydrolase (AANH) superfamily ATPase